MPDSQTPPLDVSRIRMEMAQVIQFNVDNPHPPVSPENKQFRFEQGLALVLPNEPQKIGVRAIFSISLINPEDDRVLAHYHADFLFGFSFTDLADFISPGPPIIVEKNLHMTLLTLVYSTARGMLLTQGRGTPFEHAILPIVPPAALLPTTEAKTQT